MRVAFPPKLHTAGLETGDNTHSLDSGVKFRMFQEPPDVFRRRRIANIKIYDGTMGMAERGPKEIFVMREQGRLRQAVKQWDQVFQMEINGQFRVGKCPIMPSLCKKAGVFARSAAHNSRKTPKFTNFIKMAHGLRSFRLKPVELPVRAQGNRTVARVLVIPTGKG